MKKSALKVVTQFSLQVRQQVGELCACFVAALSLRACLANISLSQPNIIKPICMPNTHAHSHEQAQAMLASYLNFELC